MHVNNPENQSKDLYIQQILLKFKSVKKSKL